MATVLVLAGGGIKSAVAAARFAKENSLVLLHLDYGQPSAAAEHRALVGLMPSFPNSRLVRLSLPHVLELNRDVVEHARPGVVHAAPLPDTAEKKTQPSAVAPASLRGLAPVLLAVGAQAALRFSADALVVGLAGTDSRTHLGLPRSADADARKEFIHSFAAGLDILLGRNRVLSVEAPLMDLDYSNVVRLGFRFEIPFANTWSCLLADPGPCGRCEGCVARREAFAGAGRIDPLVEASSGASRRARVDEL